MEFIYYITLYYTIPRGPVMRVYTYLMIEDFFFFLSLESQKHHFKNHYPDGASTWLTVALHL